MDTNINSKKKIIIGSVVGVIVLLVIMLIVKSILSKPTLITITGEGKVLFKPTQAGMTVTIATFSAGAVQGLADNLRLTKNIITGVKKVGVKQEDIIVSFAQISPIDAGNGKVMYQAANAIGITTKNLSNFNGLITQLYSDGAYSVSNIVFTTDNAKQLEKDAIQKAVEDAKARAKEVAKSIGKSVGRMVSITTSEVGGAGAVAGKIQGLGVVTSSPNQIEISRQAAIVFEMN
ncbi:MAG: SIMPL domain-containing protein [Nitrosarchaeum sp.]|nr:SIMPL domain-containing protein [Nitrosarchaeum sp.]